MEFRCGPILQVTLPLALLLKLSLLLRALWVLCTPVFCPIPASPGKSPSLIGLFVTPSHSSHPGCRVESALHHFPRRYRQMSRYGSQTPSWTFCHNQGSSWFKACIRIRRHDEAIHAVVWDPAVWSYLFWGEKYLFCSWVWMHLWVLVCLILGYQRPPLNFFQSPIAACGLSPPQLQRDQPDLSLTQLLLASIRIIVIMILDIVRCKASKSTTNFRACSFSQAVRYTHAELIAISRLKQGIFELNSALWACYF